MNELLKSLAPLLGTAIAGPFGGVAATFIASKLGLPGSTVQSVSEAIQSGTLTPEQISSIRLAEIEFKKWMDDNEIKREQLAVEDRKSARDMMQTTRAHTPAVLTYIITIGFFGVLGSMLYWPDLKESTPLMIMLGSLGTAWTGACGFWFGTTHNSQAKTEMLAKADSIK